MNKVYRVRAFNRHGHMVRDIWRPTITMARECASILYELSNYDWIVTIDEYKHNKEIERED